VRRLDDQVKVNGFRIELAEIENVFALHASVEQAVCLVRGAAPALVLYLKPRKEAEDSHSLDLEDITSFASRSLTYYMMPK
jgi:nonribosomal peptide synthetase DhbF